MSALPKRAYCPMCGKELCRAYYADDVLHCPRCGPAVYLGGSGGRDLEITDEHPAPEDAERGSPGEAIQAALPWLAKLVGTKRG